MTWVYFNFQRKPLLGGHLRYTVASGDLYEMYQNQEGSIRIKYLFLSLRLIKLDKFLSVPVGISLRSAANSWPTWRFI